MAAEQLLEAVKTGDAILVEQLIGGDPALVDARSDNGFSAVMLAMYYGHPAIATMLVNNGATLNIFEAAAVGKTEIVKAFVTANPPLVKEYAPDGFTALQLASFFGHADAAEALLKAGAQVNAVAQNPQKVMALHSAIAGNHTAVTRVLLAYDADVNATQEAGITPLHESAQNGNLEITEMLLAHGAILNVASADGKTPLALAVDYGHEAVAGLLRDQAMEIDPHSNRIV